MNPILARVLRRPALKAPARSVQLSRVLCEELERMLPGQVLVLHGPGTRDTALIDFDDLIHIMELANMTVRSVA